MNGFELALQLKQVHPSCRLLLFSGQAATAALAQHFGLEFTNRGYNFTLLPKPIHPAVLLEKLHESLARAG
jgi:hypothetical protein